MLPPPDEFETRAVGELAGHMEKISGAKLPSATVAAEQVASFTAEAKAKGQTPIFIGRNAGAALAKTLPPERGAFVLQVTKDAVMIAGNGGWGRIIFELEDAGGQRWTSIGAPMGGEARRWMADWMSEKELAAMKTMSVGDWNTNDPWQRSRINFEGWRYLRFPLPGNYPGEGYHWPHSSQWKHTGDGVVKYPLKFRKLIVELPEKALYLTTSAPVPRAEIYVKDLMVTYDSPEKAFVAP